MCYGHIPVPLLSLSLPIWSTLLTTLSSSDQGQLSTVCYCPVQMLASTELKGKIGLIQSSYKCCS